MNLRFEFRILTEEGECIVSDWTIFDPAQIDNNGAVAQIDVLTGTALRFVRRQRIAGRLEREST